MKKNKTIAYMLAATLLVGGTFAGTKALFESKVTAQTDLVITTGSLKLEDVTNTELGYDRWIPKKVDAEIGGNGNNFTNVKPGTGFKRHIILKNTGSLTQDIEVSGGELKENEVFEGTVKFEVVSELTGKTTTFTSLEELSKTHLYPNDKLHVYYDVDVKDINNDYQSNTYSLNNVFSSIEINGKNLK